MSRTVTCGLGSRSRSGARAGAVQSVDHDRHMDSVEKGKERGKKGGKRKQERKGKERKGNEKEEQGYFPQLTADSRTRKGILCN